jgi:hypothetical protein
MSGRGSVVVVLVVLVVAAGCAGSAPDVPGPDESAAADGSTPSVDPANPWGERTLTVAIRTPTGDDRDYRSLVQPALSYWNEHAERHAGYPVSFRLVEESSDADVVVAFTDAVDGCEDVDEVAGCAPHITDGSQIDRPEVAQVLTGLADESTVLVVKHELGHVLGLDHDDEPQAVMSATGDLRTLPQPNATDRPLPWAAPTISVFVDYSTVPASDRETVREQVRHALDYYARGADGHVPENVSFTVVDDRSTADVVLTFPESAPCSAGSGSCGYRYGTDPDGDGAPELYTKAEIAVADIGPAAVGWHVGYWLGYALGFTDRADWPAVLRDASAEQRRSDWWTNDSAAAVADGPGRQSPVLRSWAPAAV